MDTLRIAIALSSAGGAFWSARDKAGKPTGVPVDLGTQLGLDLGLPVRFVAYENSGQITDAAAKDEWDVTFVPMDAERAKRLAFGPVYNVDDGTFIIRAGAAIASFAELDQPGLKVAAVENTTTFRGASRALKTNPVIAYKTYDEILVLLHKGAIEAFAFSRDNLNKLAKTIPGAHVLSETFQQTKTAIAVPPGRPDVLAAATKFMAEARTNGVLRHALDANGLHDTRIRTE